MKRLKRPSWMISENKTTPEAVFWNRRNILAMGGVAGGAALLTGIAFNRDMPMAQAASEAAPRTSGLPAPNTPYAPPPTLNPAFADAGRAVTDEDVNSTYNNFYEFGSHKQIYNASQALDTDGWSVTLDGEVEAPKTIAMEDLLKRMPIEERIYRHRCVEAWSMVVPWIGFPLSALVAEAKPLSSAKYVRFETFMDPDMARGQRQHWYPWPYTEAVTIEEAANDLTMMVVGAYGKVLPHQFGAPMRLHLPWKYGFKSIKSIVRVSFVEERPVGFWEELQSAEYGFWANVNPAISHPRWSQASERVLGTEERIPTIKWNGYGEQVAGMYAGLEEKYADRLWR
ncbi:MAG: protein-methionine-sulfoxide reductase catalytic subunit MsrP [Pseudomonadota bacterium]